MLRMGESAVKDEATLNNCKTEVKCNVDQGWSKVAYWCNSMVAIQVKIIVQWWLFYQGQLNLFKELRQPLFCIEDVKID